jgi:hypothetical protein
MLSFIISVGLLFLGAFLGLYLPDIDLRVPFLVHRSIVTHGFLIPLGVFLLIYKHRATPLRFFSIGLNMAMSTHLAFDLFPRSWRGFAFIHIPVWGRTQVVFSWVWIALSIIICFYLTVVLLKTLRDVLASVGSLGVIFGSYASTETIFWPAGTTLLLAIVLTLALPSNGQTILRKALRSIDDN